MSNTPAPKKPSELTRGVYNEVLKKICSITKCKKPYPGHNPECAIIHRDFTAIDNFNISIFVQGIEVPCGSDIIAISISYNTRNLNIHLVIQNSDSSINIRIPPTTKEFKLEEYYNFQVVAAKIIEALKESGYLEKNPFAGLLISVIN